jgi:ABC-type oligopeptide transport system substrate-binding subunit
LLLLLALACGTAAEPTPTQAPATGDAPASTQAPAGANTPVPTATPQATTAPPAAEVPAGALNVGHPDIGPFTFHPTTVGNPQIYVVSTTLGEGLVHFDKDKVVQPMLAESWSISPDFLT